jgi:hypothetical protein
MLKKIMLKENKEEENAKKNMLDNKEEDAKKEHAGGKQ